MSRLRWYLRRLGTMSPGEMRWRAATAMRAATEQWRPEASDSRILGAATADWNDALSSFQKSIGRPVLLDRQRAKVIADTHPDGAAGVIAAADRIIEGRVQYFGYREVQLARPVEWNHDPAADVRWPAIPSARLNHRSAAGDAKWIWELNRLQHLPWLAQAWLLTDEERYADTAWQHLDSWLDQNPPGYGIAWRGAFEAGVRAVSVAITLQGLRDSGGFTTARFRATTRMLAESARRCWTDRSRFSSANNHLVGELAGLAVVSLLLPELAGSARGLDRALNGLSVEAGRQILADGGGAEQAFAYQLFTADLFLVVAALLRLDGREIPLAISGALRRSSGFLSALVGEGDPPPRFGDDDEGFALRLDAAPLLDVRTHLGSVAAVTGAPAVAGTVGLSAAWLGGGQQMKAAGPPDVAGSFGSLHAPDAGLVLLRSGRRRITVDVGPLGYLAIAAHGHSDALSVSLAVDGADVIGDPGAGSYYGHPSWRMAHRSTLAHATASVDGLDQSVTGGPFLWTKHAGVRVLGVDLIAGVVDAEHDGYERLAEPVRHRRWLVAPLDKDAIVVVDLVTGTGVHEVRTAWPLHPDLAVSQVGNSAHRVTRIGVPVLDIIHAATASVALTEVRGDQSTGLGWWSHRLESREPSWLVGAKVRGPVPLVVATVLRLARDTSNSIDQSTVSIAGQFIELSWREAGSPCAVEIDISRPASVRVRDVQQ